MAAQGYNAFSEGAYDIPPSPPYIPGLCFYLLGLDVSEQESYTAARRSSSRPIEVQSKTGTRVTCDGKLRASSSFHTINATFTRRYSVHWLYQELANVVASCRVIHCSWLACERYIRRREY